MASDEASKSFAFTPTIAVATGRAHNQFVACPACRADTPEYLFHREGVRFVRCRGCGVVYVNPARERPINYLAVERGPMYGPKDRELVCWDFGRLLDRLADDHRHITGEPLERTLLLGRYLPEFAEVPEAKKVGLEIAPLDDRAFEQVATASDLTWAKPYLAKQPQVVILNELLETTRDIGTILETLVASLPESTLFAVTYTNTDSLPARVMRRYWSWFFDLKSTFLGTTTLAAVCARYGLVLKYQYAQPMTRTSGYVGGKLSLRLRVADQIPVPLRVGAHVAVFGRAARDATASAEKLSIVLPVYNEVRYAGAVIDAVLAKQLRIDREVIIVESGSTDGTREVIQRFEGRPGVKVIYEDQPRGKGHAVRTGLQHVTGTIVLIQDADFEYDIDDYDALLEPILQRKATFVLGSRSLGLDDWKVRQLGDTPVRRVLLNAAQVMYAKTFNLLYQQRVTDVNTMFKVFRADCLEGLDLKSDGFDLDIELACKLARNGNSPMEVPVNYVARGFSDGKKIRFLRDAIPTYLAFFRYRFE